MILIADCHASPLRGNDAEFMALLGALAASREDVVFLGDILDLWIALPRYEQDLHRRFLDWCRRESQRRRVGFVEGNHEFFVARRHAEAFSFCSAAEYVDDQARLYVHGDTVNRADKAYRLFRAVVRSPVIRWAEEVTPGAPAVAAFVKRHLNRRREALPKVYPADQVAAYAHAWYARGVRSLYLGHFHEARQSETADGGWCQVIPAWCGSGRVGLVPAGGTRATAIHWQELAARR